MAVGLGRSCRVPSLLAVFALLLGSTCWAGDYFLTLGGGYNPTGNQVSLEKNVLMFQQFLQEQYPQGVPHDIYFADGDSPGRDLQFADPNFQIPRANRLLAQLCREENNLGYRYRSHQVPGVKGPSVRGTIETWFNEVGSKLADNDRLVIYFTGHGGKTDDAANTVIHLWNQERFSMREFTALLDKVPAQVPVIVVMVQCYSGGFSNTIFKDGKAGDGATPANRCGFFATVQDRVAAGCTPDIEEENYKEYSSYFWAAMRGKTRLGEPIDRPDIDLDGRISLAEAHAFALLQSETIDISIKTSDALLRSVSRTTGEEPGLLTLEAPYAQLIAAAMPVERAVLDGLSLQLGLTDAHRGKQARELAESLQKEMTALDEQKKTSSGEFDKIRKDIFAACRGQWPELANRWDPQTVRLLADEAPSVTALIEAHAKFSDFVRLYDEINSLDERKFDLERRWVKTQRLSRSIENIALLANLKRVAPPAVRTRVRALLALEGSAL